MKRTEKRPEVYRPRPDISILHSRERGERGVLTRFDKYQIALMETPIKRDKLTEAILKYAIQTMDSKRLKLRARGLDLSLEDALELNNLHKLQRGEKIRILQ